MKEEQDQIVADREAVEREKIALKEQIAVECEILKWDRADLKVRKAELAAEREAMLTKAKEAAELEDRAKAQKRENEKTARDLEAREEVVKKSIRSWRKH